MPHTVFAQQALPLALEPAAWSDEARALPVTDVRSRKAASFEAVGIDFVDGSLAMRHHAASCDCGCALAALLYPGFRLRSRAADGLRPTCFWFGDQAALRVGGLPAIDAVTGKWVVDALSDDRVFVVEPDAVDALQRGRADAVASSVV